MTDSPYWFFVPDRMMLKDFKFDYPVIADSLDDMLLFDSDLKIFEVGYRSKELQNHDCLCK